VKNTKLNMMYRDGANYKNSMAVVLSGAISSEQFHELKDRLVDGYMLIAEQVGLPTPSFAFLGYDNWPSDDMDHSWTTMVDFDEGGVAEDRYMSLRTNDDPTVDMSISTLVERLRGTEWDDVSEWERMVKFSEGMVSADDLKVLQPVMNAGKYQELKIKVETQVLKDCEKAGEIKSEDNSLGF